MANTAVIETALAQSASEGISSLFQLGAVTTVLILVILLGIIAFRWAFKTGTDMFNTAIKQCEQREERAVVNWEKSNERAAQNWEKSNEKIQRSFDTNTEVMNGLQVTLARIEAKMDK